MSETDGCRSRLKRLLTSALLLFAGNAAAEPSGRNDHASAFEPLVEQAMQRYHLPGIAFGVIENGEVVYIGTRGERVAGEGDGIDADTLFKIASNTKAMTAAVLARLVQRGLLRWDDPVTKHLPQFRMQDPWVTQHMQVRDLLIHNSGLGLGAGDLMLWPEPNHFDRADIIAGLAHLQPVSSFRSGYAYDNLLYVVAGEVAAAAAGKSYSQLVREEILQPLGMSRCQVGAWSPAAIGNVAQPHYRVDGVNKVGARDPDELDDFPSMAAGGIRCSLHDMLRWMQVLLDPEQAPGWLDQPQRRALWTLHMPMPISPRLRAWDGSHFYGYGYGWRLSDMDGQWKVAHTGTLSGMYSSLALLPDSRTGVVILINGEAEDARTALMQAALKHYTAPQASHDVTYYADLLDQERTQRHAAGHRAPDTSTRTPATAKSFAAHGGRWRDPWFGEVQLCPNADGVGFVSLKSPRMQGQLMQWQQRWLVQWRQLGEDAEAWLEFSTDDQGPLLRMSAIDPDIDFSYDYQDLQFRRIGACY